MGTKKKPANQSKDEGRPDIGQHLTSDIDGDAKPNQYGRGQHDLGRGSAHPVGRQAFLRVR